ncbi:MAG TPA: 16S rRNA (guanine(527)-N(7))-methyltransferase RsmG [Candidatus Limnocylindrales bacterium]|nr:16S rRNA (guanine(527)-N(7))-methyltransferase RsmG [Candidatus Limnocylindrales bacterium]
MAESAREQLDAHVRLLIAWNEAINLTAVHDPAAIAVRHVVDSLSGVAILRERGIDAFVDLGSGGGYPGLPLAVVLPGRRAVLVESIAKKARFLAVVSAALGLAERITVRPGRAEEAAGDPGERERWPAVTARAVAELAELIELAFPLLAVGGCLVAWKRDPAASELAAGERAAIALGGGRLEVMDVVARGLVGHRLVVVTKAGRTPDGFPRPPGARRRRPW